MRSERREPQLAAMLSRDALDDRQPQAGTAAIAMHEGLTSALRNLLG